MPINPFDVRGSQLRIPENARLVPLDFSPLSQIGDVIGGYRQQQRVGEIISSATNAQGNLDFDRAGAALAAEGLTRYAEPLLAAGARRQALGQAERSLTEQTRHHKAIEDAAKTGRVPFGWEPDPTAAGGYRPTPGGPQDPAYIEKLTQLKAKPREFTMSEITKLSEEAGKFANVSRFGETFQDKYAGYMHPTVGAAAQTAGRYLPESMVGKDVAESATWWQDYNRYKQVVRNELYGASLQPNEQRDFEAADINPGMQPQKIRDNLKIQQDIVRNGLKRRANAGIAAGYDPEVIGKAYGLDLSELGVEARGRRGTVTPAPTTTAPVRVSSPEEARRLPKGTPIILPDGTPGRVP
jgi:hypothetical protein